MYALCCNVTSITHGIKAKGPIPVAARCKAYVYDSPLAGTAGSNPTGNMYVFLLCAVRQSSLQRANHSSRKVLPIVIGETQRGGLAPLGLSSHEKKRVARDSKTRTRRKQGKHFVFWQSVHRAHGTPEKKYRRKIQQIVKTGDSEPAASNVTAWASVESRGGRYRNTVMSG